MNRIELPLVRLAAIGRVLLSSLCLLIVIIAAQTAPGQSGRVQRKGDLPTTASPTAEPASQPSPGQPQVPALSLIASEFVPRANVAIYSESAYRNFVGRLQESNRITVSAQKEMRRKDAIDLAKSQTTAYVVWLELEVDLGAGDIEKDAEKAAFSPVNPGCLFITYIVFAPVTGQTRTQGRVYQPGYQSRCVGGVYHPSPYPDGPQPKRLPAEDTLKQAAREAADRVMAAFDIPLPAKHP